jgi:hypothetical protein
MVGRLGVNRNSGVLYTGALGGFWRYNSGEVPMRLSFCDSCGKPLSEGAVARGDAIERKSGAETELVCSACVADEQSAPQAGHTGPLGAYEEAIWSCEGCGIPVQALDFIEGRASRLGGRIRCARCKPAEPASTTPAEPKPKPAPRRPPAPVRPGSIRHSPNAAKEFVQTASKGERRPVVPIVLFTVVLTMFAVSMYFAISSQQRYNQLMANRDNTETPERTTPPRRETPTEGSVPPLQVDVPPAPAGESDRDPPPDPAPRPAPTSAETVPIPADVAEDLVAIERDLAAPVIRKLQSEKLSEVWEGLITAGSRRLVVTRPFVRRLLEDSDDDTRLLACRVAGLLEDREALPLLARLADADPDEQVRIEARQARDRMLGVASREVRDMTDAELEELLTELQAELERRRGEQNND